MDDEREIRQTDAFRFVFQNRTTDSRLWHSATESAQLNGPTPVTWSYLSAIPTRLFQYETSSVIWSDLPIAWVYDPSMT